MKRVMVAALCLSLTGCTGSSPDPNATTGQSTRKDDVVERVMSEEDAKALVDGYGQRVLEALGAPADDTRIAPSPCQGKRGELAQDGRFYMQGNYRVPLPGPEHVATLTRMRDAWVKQGFEVTDYRTFAPDEATVDVRNPADGVQISLTSNRPPTAIAVVVYSPCLRPPAT